MALAQEVVARKYLNVSADTAISVDIVAFEASDIYVYYGKNSLLAAQVADYDVELAEDFNTFTVTPRQALIDKINGLIEADATETNYITVRRTLDYETEATAAGVRYTPFTAKEFDRCAMRDQQLADELGRSLKLPAATLAGDVDTSLANIQPGQYVRRSDDGSMFTGATGEVEVSEITAWYRTRDTSTCEQASQLSDGTVVMIEGLPYEVDSTKTGTASATYDLGVDGLVPFGLCDPKHVGMVMDGVTDDRDKLIRAMQINAPAPVDFSPYPGVVVGMSESIQVYDKTLFPVQPGGFVSSTPWIHDELEVQGDGSTTEFTTTFDLCRVSVTVNDYEQTKKLQPYFTSLITVDYTKDNDYQLYRRSKKVKFTYAPASGDTVRITSRRPGVMFRAIGDWRALALNIQKNAFFPTQFLLSDPVTISGWTLRNVGFDCNGVASNAIRGKVNNPHWDGIYILGARAYSLQSNLVGGIVKNVTIDHVFPVNGDELDTGVTSGEDVVVPARRAFVANVQNSDPDADLYVWAYFNDGVNVGKANNGWDFGWAGTLIQRVTVHMHGSDWEAAFWANGADSGAEVHSLTVYDGVIGGEQATDVTFNNARALMSGAIDENRILDPEDFTTANWSRTSLNVTASSETPPTGVASAQLLTTTGATSFPRLEQTIDVEADDACWSTYVKAGTATRCFLEVAGSKVNKGSNTTSRYRFTFATETLEHNDGQDDCHVQCVSVGNGWYRFSIATEENETLTKVTVRPELNTAAIVTLHVAGAQLSRRRQSYAAAGQSLGARYNLYKGKVGLGRYVLNNCWGMDNGAAGNVCVGATVDTDVTVIGGRTECDKAVNAHGSSPVRTFGFDVRRSNSKIASSTGSFNADTLAVGCPGLSENAHDLLSQRTSYPVENVYLGAMAAAAVHTVQFNGADLEVSANEIYEVFAYKNANANPDHHARVRVDNTGNIDVQTVSGGSGDLIIAGSGDNLTITNNNAGNVATHIVTNLVSKPTAT